MKKFYLLAALLISFSTITTAQLPIAYYDFENSTHSTFQNQVDMEVNAGTSTALTNNNGTMTNGSGAGTYYGGSSSGKCLQVYLGASSSNSDPKTSATHYQQFKVSTSGFSGIAVVFDVTANNNNAEDYGISYSTNGSSWTWVASVTTPGSGNSCPWSTSDWGTAQINLPAGANNQSNLYIRLYEYGSGSSNSNAYLKFDNLQVTATSTVAGAGTKTMLDDISVAAGCMSASASAVTLGRNKFTVDGAGTTVNLPSLYLTGVLFGSGGNLTVSNNAVLNLNSGTYVHYISPSAFYGWMPASTVNILSGGTINLSNTLYCDGNIALGSGTININDKTLVVGGTISRTSGLINAASGTVEFAGTSAQSVSGTYFTGKNIYNLKNSNAAGLNVSSTSGDTLRILNMLSFGSVNNATINTGNNLALISTSTQTAGVADITNNGANSGNSITGNVIVEKYIASGKKWHLLSIATTTTQTYRQAWQENNASGANSNPGYGMNIYGTGSWAANGFDYASTAPTIKIYNSATASYTGISSTLNTMNTTDPHMVYLRGDRSITAASVTTSATILRTTGTLKQNTQANITVAANKFAAVSNPYAAAIDMRNISKSAGVQDFFYVWDPKLGGTYGLGAFQTFSKDGSDYVVTPGGGSYGDIGSVSNYINSGDAFFVKGNASGGTITLKENAKAGGNNVVSAGRNSLENVTINARARNLVMNLKLSNETVVATKVTAVNTVSQSLRANLYVVSADGTTLADGILANFSERYSNDVDADDAVKNANGSENVSLKRDGQLLAVERRYTAADNDTLFLNLTGVRVQNYKWSCKLSNMSQKGLVAFLVDSYLHTTTALNMNGTTDVNFDVANIPASYAADRFMIVFKKEIKPTKSETVSFMRTADATAETVTEKENSTTGISVYPNPVEGKQMNIRFANLQETVYNISLTNQAGQVVYSGKINVTGKNAVQQVKLNAATAAGTYTLMIVGENGTRSTQSVLIL